MTNNVSFPNLGLEIEISRIAFSVGSVDIYWYGILIALGMFLAIIFVLKNCISFGVNDDRLIDVILLSTVFGVIGARAFYVIFAPFEYDSFLDMINLRDGGLAIYGGVIAGFSSAFFFCKWRKIPFLPTVDLVAMGFLIGQGIGRWGNFFNQEAFGINTNSIFGMISESTTAYLTQAQTRLAQNGIIVDPNMPVHPTFLYESVWCLLGFVLLALYMKKRKFNGEIFLMYFIWYGAERAVVEGLRTDSLEAVSNLRVSQIIAIVSAICALALLIVLRKKFKDTPLKVNYDFKVYKNEKNSPTVNLTWLASEKMPTQEQIIEEYEKMKNNDETEENATVSEEPEENANVSEETEEDTGTSEETEEDTDASEETEEDTDASNETENDETENDETTKK